MTFGQHLSSRDRYRLIFHTANACAREGLPAEAAALYRQLLVLRDGKPTQYVIHRLGAALLALGEYTQAETLLRQAVLQYERDPGLFQNWAQAVDDLARLYGMQRRWHGIECMLEERLSYVNDLHEAATASGDPRPWPDATIVILRMVIQNLTVQNKHEATVPLYLSLVSHYEQKIQASSAPEYWLSAFASTSGLIHTLGDLIKALQKLHRPRELAEAEERLATLQASFDLATGQV